jgi:hypothetical protein
MASARLQWYGNEMTAAIHQAILDRLTVLGQYLQGKIRDNIASGSSPSSPGDFPAQQSGDLAKSITYSVDPVHLVLSVGTTSPYGLYLEFGTAGGKTLTAAPGQVFSWIDPNTGDRVFSRTMKLGRIKPRSFLRRTFDEEWPTLNQMLTGTIAGQLGSPA